MPVTNYHTLNGRIRGETTSGTRTNYLTDALGSITATVNSSAVVVNTYRNKPFGRQLAKTGVGADPKYQHAGDTGSRKTSRTYSEQYNEHRHLGTTQGQWTTVDMMWPIQPAYKYCCANPITNVDPSGALPQQVSVGGPLDCGNPGDPRWGPIIGNVIPGYWKKVSDVIAKDDCCIALIKKNVGSGVGMFDLGKQLLEILEAYRWLRRVVFCINCIETWDFKSKYCIGPHGSGSTATGLFGFLDGTWGDFGSGDRTNIDDQLKSGIHMLCVELCKRSGGCECSDPRAIPKDKFGRPSIQPWINPWPGRVWPYMPGGTDSDSKKNEFKR